MKKIVLVLIIASLAFSAAYSQAAKTDKKAPAKTESKAAKPGKGLTGSVVGVMDAAAGNITVLTKAKALELVKKGQPIGLLTGKGKAAKLYMLANPEGSIIGEKLANLADKPVYVEGKKIGNAGVNIIVYDKLENAK